MDALRLGTVCRTLRIKKGWRQLDLAVRVGVTRSDVSRLERGHIGELDVDVVVRVVAAFGGRLDFKVWWQGGELNRLLNAPGGIPLGWTSYSFVARCADWGPDVLVFLVGRARDAH